MLISYTIQITKLSDNPEKTAAEMKDVCFVLSHYHIILTVNSSVKF